MRIGVLAVQGAFAEHSAKVCQLGAEAVEIRKRHDIQTELDGLILPGGESTAMRKLLTELDLLEPLKEMIQNGLPVFGTCAGMILLAKEVSGGGTPCFGTLDISVHRNAYGRQLGSFRCVDIFAGKEIEMPLSAHRMQRMCVIMSQFLLHTITGSLQSDKIISLQPLSIRN